MKKLSILFAMMFASGAYAGEGSSASFTDLDKNQDGQVSMDEARDSSKLRENWSQVDADSSGTIDQAEFSAFETMEKPAPTGGGME